MDNYITINGEPYTAEELRMKTDPETYVWQAEMADWAENVEGL